jgi:hypothetical protein
MGKFTLKLDRDSALRKSSHEFSLSTAKARMVELSSAPTSRLHFGFTVVVTFIMGFGLAALTYALVNIMFNGASWPRLF